MVDVLVAAVALLTYVVVQRRPRPAHLTATIVLALLTGLWIWANLRPTDWKRDIGVSRLPAELDFVTKGMFFRGWPLSPCWFSLITGMRFHADRLQPMTLVFDWLVLVVALKLAKIACERRPRKPVVPNPSVESSHLEEYPRED
ncbi:hypothetical protein [Paludisphaera rhizosphaerae]|uniref:hypothetical protein n=1 Tax=Paludisphaera rhizosphaerae TaxID=2711216 RepID=UPI0013EB42EA|nr:hypothetical protein [Paludisphaera rhizosphaerae]